MKKIVIIYERETRSRRVQLVTEPSEFEEFKKNCKEEGVSVNEKINRFIIAYNAQRRGEKV